MDGDEALVERMGRGWKQAKGRQGRQRELILSQQWSCCCSADEDVVVVVVAVVRGRLR